MGLLEIGTTKEAHITVGMGMMLEVAMGVVIGGAWLRW